MFCPTFLIPGFQGPLQRFKLPHFQAVPVNRDNQGRKGCRSMIRGYRQWETHKWAASDLWRGLRIDGKHFAVWSCSIREECESISSITWLFFSFGSVSLEIDCLQLPGTQGLKQMEKSGLVRSLILNCSGSTKWVRGIDFRKLPAYKGLTLWRIDFLFVFLLWFYQPVRINFPNCQRFLIKQGKKIFLADTGTPGYCRESRKAPFMSITWGGSSPVILWWHDGLSFFLSWGPDVALIGYKLHKSLSPVPWPQKNDCFTWRARVPIRSSASYPWFRSQQV
jgi:hypothetical protein